MDTQAYLERNKDIVDNPQYRSGTWSTIEYSQKKYQFIYYKKLIYVKYQNNIYYING